MAVNRLLSLLPEYYRNIKEFRELTNAESIELDTVSRALQQVDDDMFILTSSEVAIKNREKMFRILADPAVEDLDLRKRRIISRQTTSFPFTERFLASQLRILTGGPDLYSIDVDSRKLELHVVTQIGVQGGLEELWYMLENIVPLNVAITTENELYATCESVIYLPTTSAYVAMVELTHDYNADYSVEGDSRHGTILTGFTTMELQ